MKTERIEAVSKRFISVMNEIMENQTRTGGKITTVKYFAQSIGQLPQNFSKFRTEQQNVTLPIIEAVCRVYRVNPIFLILGEGERFLPKKSENTNGKLSDIERRLKRLEKLIK